MKQLFSSIALFLLLAHATSAQTRYLRPVFNNVQVTNDVRYGINASILEAQVRGQAVPENLLMDVYRPMGDNVTNRPLILYFHTGNFLPFNNPATGAPGFNGSCGGTRRDSATIEMCTRLAKLGYVVASCTYRQGWNALAATDVERRQGLINAAYRGIQDARTAIRFFKKSVRENSNTYGIDSTKIVLWGQGTGGYITLGTATLDRYNKIVASETKGKFIWDHDGNAATPPRPMVIEQLNGNPDGTTVGINPQPNPSAPNNIDTINYPNHVGYSSNFQLMVNLGGALGDSSWVDRGQVPMISFQTPLDPFAPYNEGIVVVPGPGQQQVVQVQGAYVIQKMAQDFGNNNIIRNAGTTLDLADAQARAFATSPVGLRDPRVGLYPFNRQLLDSAPWEWSAAVPGNPTCNLSKPSAMLAIDTIMRFYAPRACFALGLQSCVNTILSEKEPIATNIDVAMAPNPAFDQITFSSGQPILRIELYNNLGAVVSYDHNVRNETYTFRRNSLPAGLYVAKISFKEGFVTKMVQFQ